MSRKLLEAVRAAGHDVVGVLDWEPSAPDPKVIARAKDESRTIITLDRDIPALVLRSGRSAPSVLRLARLSSFAQIPATLEALRLHEADFERGALVTVTPRTTRIRRLASEA